MFVNVPVAFCSPLTEMRTSKFPTPAADSAKSMRMSPSASVAFSAMVVQLSSSGSVSCCEALLTATYRPPSAAAVGLKSRELTDLPSLLTFSSVLSNPIVYSSKSAEANANSMDR